MICFHLLFRTVEDGVRVIYANEIHDLFVEQFLLCVSPMDLGSTISLPPFFALSLPAKKVNRNFCDF